MYPLFQMMTSRIGSFQGKKKKNPRIYSNNLISVLDFKLICIDISVPMYWLLLFFFLPFLIITLTHGEILTNRSNFHDFSFLRFSGEKEKKKKETY